MKTIGLLGGMSWESTLRYYRVLNQGVKTNLGGLHSAKICMVSVDFDEIEKLQQSGDWDETAVILSKAAQAVEAGGADFLLICTNTMHKVADAIQDKISIPILHIADTTAKQLLKDKITTVGLLGTQFTMQQEFYKGRLINKFDIQVVVPNEEDQILVHKVIYNELCLGDINKDSREKFLQIIERLYVQGAQAVILGCTEIALLIQQKHTKVPLYDTTEIHAKAAVEYALDD